MATNLDAAQQSTEIYFAVSIRKLVILSICSLGIYTLWWMFKNWKYVEQATGKKVFPGLRAFFGIIFIYPLLKQMRKTGEECGMQESLAAGFIATAYIAWSIIARFLPDQLFIVGIFSFLPLIVAQKYVNKLNLAVNPNCLINDKLTKGNWVWIIGGGLILVLAVVGTFLPARR